VGGPALKQAVAKWREQPIKARRDAIHFFRDEAQELVRCVEIGVRSLGISPGLAEDVIAAVRRWGKPQRLGDGVDGLIPQPDVFGFQHAGSVGPGKPALNEAFAAGHAAGAAEMRERALVKLDSLRCPGTCAHNHCISIDEGRDVVAALPLTAPSAGVPVDETKGAQHYSGECPTCGNVCHCKACR
jgi:hypothetical protein